MRPRDLLRFLHTAVDVAINRGHNLIAEDDLIQAEKAYSEDLLVETGFEIADTNPSMSDIVFAFQGAPPTMNLEDAKAYLMLSGIESEEQALEAIDLLISFAYFGVTDSGSNEPRYAYSVHGNMRRLFFPLEKQNASAGTPLNGPEPMRVVVGFVASTAP
jgi:hypothetical protein